MATLNNRSVGFLLFGLLIATLVAYYPALNVPFYLDDRTSIVENELIKSGTIYQLYQHYGLRFVTYFSFWLNEQLFDGSLKSYHLINVAIHICNGLVIFLVVKSLCSNIAKVDSERANVFALFCVVIWIVHPLNTQAVTYVVQRTASLVALFWLLSTYFYLKLKFERLSAINVLLLLVFVVSGCLTKTKLFYVFSLCLFI